MSEIGLLKGQLKELKTDLEMTSARLLYLMDGVVNSAYYIKESIEDSRQAGLGEALQNTWSIYMELQKYNDLCYEVPRVESLIKRLEEKKENKS
jgi:hypothetical protein